MREQQRTKRSTATDVDLAEACEGEREGDDVWCDVADDHDLVRVRWNEFAGHFGYVVLKQ